MHNFVSGCSEGVNSTFANHFQTNIGVCKNTCVVYTNELYLNYFHKTLQELIWLVHEVDYHLLIWRLQIIKTNYSPPHPPHTQKKKKNWKKPVIHLGCHLGALVFSRMPWFQVSKISFSNRWWHNDSKKQKTTLLVLLPFCYLEWLRQNFSLQYQYNTKQTSNEIKEKYKLGDYNVIQYQILQTWTV